MNKETTQLDLDAEREGTAENAYRENFSRTLDFGQRLKHTRYVPADVVHHRKRRRPKCSKQIDLRKLALQNRLDNPELYRDIREQKQAKAKLEKPKMAMIKRKINGIEVELSPVENFIHQTGYRVRMIREQLKQLGKQKGTNYEYTPEHIGTIETELLTLVDKYLDQLRNPKTVSTDGYDFSATLRKV